MFEAITQERKDRINEILKEEAIERGLELYPNK